MAEVSGTAPAIEAGWTINDVHLSMLKLGSFLSRLPTGPEHAGNSSQSPPIRKAEVIVWDNFETKQRTKRGKIVFCYVITPVIFQGG